MNSMNRKDPEDNLIITNVLTKKFCEQPAVDSVDLRVPRGAILGFIGPSGCAKTTTIRLLTGIHDPTAGEAIVLGSAFHVPARVHIDRPERVPSSQSSAPHLAWQLEGQTHFDLEDALGNWGVEAPNAAKLIKATKPKQKK